MQGFGFLMALTSISSIELTILAENRYALVTAIDDTPVHESVVKT